MQLRIINDCVCEEQIDEDICLEGDPKPNEHNTASTFQRAESSSEQNNATFGKNSQKSASDRPQMRKVSSIEGLFDKNVAERQKKLLYDKQLKAYYDQETGEYFELNA